MNRQTKLYQLMHQEYSSLKENMYGIERDLTVLEKYIGDAANNSIKPIKGESFSKALRVFRTELEGSNVYLSKLNARVKEMAYASKKEDGKQEIIAHKKAMEEFLGKYDRCFNCVKMMKDETEKMRLIARKELEHPEFLSGKLTSDIERVLAQSMYVNRLVDSISAGVTKSFKIGNLNQIVNAKESFEEHLKTKRDVR